MAKRIQTEHNVLICKLVDDEPVEPQSFSATKSECLDFLNTRLTKEKIRSFGKAQVLIEIDDVLYTEDMLKEKGVLTVQ